MFLMLFEFATFDVPIVVMKPFFFTNVSIWSILSHKKSIVTKFSSVYHICIPDGELDAEKLFYKYYSQDKNNKKKVRSTVDRGASTPRSRAGSLEGEIFRFYTGTLRIFHMNSTVLTFPPIKKYW